MNKTIDSIKHIPSKEQIKVTTERLAALYFAAQMALNPISVSAQEPAQPLPPDHATTFLPLIATANPEAEPTNKQFEVQTENEFFRALTYAEIHKTVNVLIIITVPELEISTVVTLHERERISPDPNPEIVDTRWYRSAIYIPPRSGQLHITSSADTKLLVDAAVTDAILYAEDGTDVTLSNLRFERTGAESSAEGLAYLTRYLIVGDTITINNVSLTNTAELTEETEPEQPDPTKADPRLVGGIKAFGPLLAEGLRIDGVGWDGLVTVGEARLRYVRIERSADSREAALKAGVGVAMYLDGEIGNSLFAEQVQLTNYLKGALVIDLTDQNQLVSVAMSDITMDMNNPDNQALPTFYYILATIGAVKIDAQLNKVSLLSNHQDRHGSFAFLNAPDSRESSILISDSTLVCDATVHPMFGTEGPGYCTEIPRIEILSGNAAITIYHRPNQLFFLDEKLVPLSMYVAALRERGFTVTTIEVNATQLAQSKQWPAETRALGQDQIVGRPKGSPRPRQVYTPSSSN